MKLDNHFFPPGLLPQLWKSPRHWQHLFTSSLGLYFFHHSENCPRPSAKIISFFWGFTNCSIHPCKDFLFSLDLLPIITKRATHILRFITSLYGVTPIFGQAKGTEPGVWGQHFKCFLSEGEKEALEGTSPLSSCYRKKRRWWKTYLTNLFCSVFLWSVM